MQLAEILHTVTDDVVSTPAPPSSDVALFVGDVLSS